MDFTTFRKFIKKNDIIKDYHIQLSGDAVLYIDSFTTIEIYNCTFQGGNLIIHGNNNESKIDNLIIEKSSIEGLKIIGLQFNHFKISDINVDYIEIIKSSFKNLSIIGLNKVNYNIRLDGIRVKNRTEILGNIFIDDGSLSIFDSELNNCNFIESTFNDVLIQSSCLKGYFDFYKNNLNPESERFLFSYSTFEKTNFSRTTLSNNTVFENCDFSEIAIFREVYDYPGSTLIFESCLFQKYIQFNYAKIWDLEIYNTKFSDVSSFQDARFNTISIDTTIFEKIALFDGIKIKNINSINIRTLRNIKQQLQRTDNKIDYNRFRSYELAAYYKEITWKDDFIDKFILSTTWFSTGFDHSWLRALSFTLLSGLMFFSLFLISEEYINSFTVYSYKEFFSGYFRFLLITDFYNPLINKREFLTEPVSWLPFILGKIFIAFGIYEMIQAFRKFKA